jgi:protein-disulfide isomerase
MEHPVTRPFALTFDYLCPFARIVHEHVLDGLAAGAEWDVRFLPYSLAQGHLEEGAVAVWDRPDPAAESGVLALQVGLAVRDGWPDAFLALHRRLFALRHDDGADLKDRDAVAAAIAEVGLDPAEVLAAVATGAPLTTLAAEHRAGVDDHEVWGVPTFIAGGRAVFVRLIERSGGDGDLARQRIDRVLDLVEGMPELHEFKQTDLPF